MGQLVAAGGAQEGGTMSIPSLRRKDSVQDVDRLSEKLRGHDVAIDFSVAAGVLKSIEGLRSGECATRRRNNGVGTITCQTQEGLLNDRVDHWSMEPISQLE